jgi:NADPH:quinone reductase-like Zn-dependent oxidoreductase
MKAVVRDEYGIDHLELRDIEEPAPGAGEVLVRVRAAAINPADWYTAAGPIFARVANGLRRPKSNRLGTDFAGTVEAVGKDVTRFRVGDDVFGARTGALAEYVTVPEDRAIASKPANTTFEEAAGVGIAAVTALQGLRDKGEVRPGQTVLITGASGGVGTFAVQIAKALGAEVTAVCSTPNVEMVRSLGADRVIDYTRDDFTRGDKPYDLILDIASTHSWGEARRVLKPNATLVLVGAPKGKRALGPLRQIARIFLAGRLRGSQKVVFYVAKLTNADINAMRELLESGKVKTVVDRTYPLSEAADAFRYFGEGHARGKVVVTVGA